MDRKRMTSDYDPPRGTTGTMAKWVFVGFVGLVLIGGLAWGVRVLTMPIRSATGVAERTLDPDNVIATYERFHDRWKGFKARKAQVQETASLWRSETDAAERGRLGIEMRAQRQSCRDIAAGYNADAAKTNRDIFRGREAPATLDAVECER